VNVFWYVDCSRGLKFSSNSSSFSIGTPIDRVLRHSLYHPYTCDVYADGSINRRGSLHLWLTYTPWG